MKAYEVIFIMNNSPHQFVEYVPADNEDEAMDSFLEFYMADPHFEQIIEVNFFCADFVEGYVDQTHHSKTH